MACCLRPMNRSVPRRKSTLRRAKGALAERCTSSRTRRSNNVSDMGDSSGGLRVQKGRRGNVAAGRVPASEDVVEIGPFLAVRILDVVEALDQHLPRGIDR